MSFHRLSGTGVLAVLLTSLASEAPAEDLPPAGALAAMDAGPIEQIEVTGAVDRSYVRLRSTAATKSDQPLIETPMAVQSVAAEVIEDQRALTILDAIQNVSGVQTQQGSYYDQYQIRGFGSGYGVTYRNGLQLEGIADSVNLSFVDHIEVVKGPASMLYGRVEPGGFVDVVTRRPQLAPAFAIEQRAGSWGQYRTVFDATGALDPERRLAARLIADVDRGDNFFDYDHHDRKAAYLALDLQPGRDVSVSLDLEYYDYRTAGRGPNTTVPFGPAGYPDPTGIPISGSSSDPTLWRNFPDTVKRTLLSTSLDIALAEHWKLTSRFHYVWVDEVQTGLGDWGPSPTGTVDEWGFIYNPLSRNILGLNLDLNGKFDLGGVENRLLLGVDRYRYADDWRGFVGYTGVTYVNRYSPAYVDFTPQLQAFVRESADNVLWKSLESASGLYFQDQLVPDERWRILLGGRLDRAYARYASVYGAHESNCYPTCTGVPIASWPSDHAFSPRMAVLYRLQPNASLYASYSKSFGTNNSSFLASGAFVPPELGIQYELGAKSSWMQDRLSAGATLFDLTKRNVLGPDPGDPSGRRQIAIGEVVSRGLELDLAGELTRRVSVIASYTYDPVFISRDTNTPDNQGHRKLGTPLHAGSAWLKYDSAPGMARGLQAGAGARINGGRYANDASTNRMPAYAVFDAMLAYRTTLRGTRLSAQLNLRNLADKIYFDQIGYGTVSYGMPRSVTGSVRADF